MQILSECVVRLGVDIRQMDATIYECLVNGEESHKAITSTEVEGLDMIPSHIDWLSRN